MCSSDLRTHSPHAPVRSWFRHRGTRTHRVRRHTRTTTGYCLGAHRGEQPNLLTWMPRATFTEKPGEALVLIPSAMQGQATTFRHDCPTADPRSSLIQDQLGICAEINGQNPLPSLHTAAGTRPRTQREENPCGYKELETDLRRAITTAHFRLDYDKRTARPFPWEN